MSVRNYILPIILLIIGMIVIFNTIKGREKSSNEIDTSIFRSSEISGSDKRNFDDYLQNTATTPLRIGDTQFFASVARTSHERTQGLSGTTFLPSNFVKLFVFDEESYWGIWMKDMNYSIDIVWLDSNKTVVYSEISVPPESYPEVFIPRALAKYVLEFNAGVVQDLQITYGQVIEFEL
jgi:uncharacterized membrane protein (UPF0127 family)